MPDSISQLRKRSIRLHDVQTSWPYTIPRTYGVYRLHHAGTSHPFRFGNHPVRMSELEREISSCSLDALFLSRNDARTLAAFLNQSNA